MKITKYKRYGNKIKLAKELLRAVKSHGLFNGVHSFKKTNYLKKNIRQ